MEDPCISWSPWRSIGSIDFDEDVTAHLDDEVWTDAEDVGSIRRVVDLAERESVRYHGISAQVMVRENASRVE
jgi:hypothetical protein